MTKEEALKLIDDHKDTLLNPIDMLHWVWVRVILLKIPDEEWQRYVDEAAVVLSR